MAQRNHGLHFRTLPHVLWPYTAELSGLGSPCWAGGMKMGWKHRIQTRPGGASLSEDIRFPRQQAGHPLSQSCRRLSM